jgi:hypothetical protein
MSTRALLGISLALYCSGSCHGTTAPMRRTSAASAAWSVEAGAAGLVPIGIACAAEWVFVLNAPRGGAHELRVWRADGALVLPAFASGMRRPMAATPSGHLYLLPDVEHPRAIAHFDGTSWSELPVLQPSGEPYALEWVADILALDETHVYFVAGGGVIARLEGDHFTVYSAGTHVDLFALDGTSPRDLWMGGAAGTLLHWDGTAFSDERAGLTDDVRDLVLSGGQPLVRRWRWWSQRAEGGWLEDRALDGEILDSPIGRIAIARDAVRIERHGHFEAEVVRWPVIGGCALREELVVIGAGYEGSPRHPSERDVHEPGDVLRRAY